MTLEPCAAALALAASSLPAVAAPCLLSASAETVAIERVLDGDVVALDDGRIVRLAGISAPKPPLGVDARDWPIGGQARGALEALTAGRVLELRTVEASPDRHGRLVGYLSEIEGEDHAGVASAMLLRGLARRSADRTGRDCNATLASAEAGAIDTRLGLWSQPYYAVRDATDSAALTASAGQFVVAEGRVASFRTSAGRAYVNFGVRWRDALSLVIAEAALRKLGGFEALGVRVGARLRARGVLESRLGPTIRVTEAAQIERLGGRTP